MSKPWMAMGVAAVVFAAGSLIRSIARTDEGHAAAPPASPAASDTREREGQAHAAAGLALYRRGDWAACVGELERVRRPPAEIQRTLGICYVKLDQIGLGILHLTQATRLAPEDPVAWRDLGVALRLAEDYEHARGALAHATRLAPADARAHSSMGVLLLDRDDPSGAVAELEKAASLDASLPFVQANLAVAYARTGRLADAEKALGQAERMGWADGGRVRTMIDGEEKNR